MTKYNRKQSFSRKYNRKLSISRKYSRKLNISRKYNRKLIISKRPDYKKCQVNCTICSDGVKHIAIGKVHMTKPRDQNPNEYQCQALLFFSYNMTKLSLNQFDFSLLLDSFRIWPKLIGHLLFLNRGPFFSSKYNTEFFFISHIK